MFSGCIFISIAAECECLLSGNILISDSMVLCFMFI